MKQFKKIILFLVVIALTAAACTVLSSCGVVSNGNTETVGSGDTVTEKNITVKVIGKDGSTVSFPIRTKAATLRGALEQEKLVEGDEGEYGLYVKTVNGIRADYDLDGAYWSFSKGGEYLMTGVDSVIISDGDVYEITYTAG